jgi:hypothetical protein
MSSLTIAVDADKVEAHADYDSAIKRLIELYSDIDEASLALPAFSGMPFLIYLWSMIKFEFALFGDVLLIVPINVVVFLRNLFPGRWRYKSFSWPYLKYCFMWFWRGECYVASFFVRPVTAFLLSAHFRRRLLMVRRRLQVDRGVPEDRQRALLSKIDDAVAIWPVPTATTVFFSYCLPAVGPVIEVARPFIPAELPIWTNFVALVSISYALSVFGTAFLAKRGLMLGGKGRAVFFPALLEKRDSYVEERELLGVFGIDIREFPFDAVVLTGGALLNGLMLPIQASFYGRLLPGLDQRINDSAGTQFGTGALIVILVALALWRRTKLQRA